MGALPDWYVLIRAARYLKVAPWELLKQPQQWQLWASEAEAAEGKAQQQKQDAEKRRAKAKGG